MIILTKVNIVEVHLEVIHVVIFNLVFGLGSVGLMLFLAYK